MPTDLALRRYLNILVESGQDDGLFYLCDVFAVGEDIKIRYYLGRYLLMPIPVGLSYIWF